MYLHVCACMSEIFCSIFRFLRTLVKSICEPIYILNASLSFLSRHNPVFRVAILIWKCFQFVLIICMCSYWIYTMTNSRTRRGCWKQLINPAWGRGKDSVTFMVKYSPSNVKILRWGKILIAIKMPDSQNELTKCSFAYWMGYLEECDPDVQWVCLSSASSTRRQRASACLRNTRRISNTARPSIHERLMDSREIILAEYQMSGKDCRIIQTRGY